MDAFLSKHKRRIAGTLSCVDRIVFKGYLPISWADSFESFLFRIQTWMPLNIQICMKRKKRLSAKVCRLFKKLHARG